MTRQRPHRQFAPGHRWASGRTTPGASSPSSLRSRCCADLGARRGFAKHDPSGSVGVLRRRPQPALAAPARRRPAIVDRLRRLTCLRGDELGCYTTRPTAMFDIPTHLNTIQRGRLASTAKVNAGLYGRTCSRSNSARSSPRKANEDSNSSSGGSPGPGVPSYPDSSNSPPRSPDTDPDPQHAETRACPTSDRRPPTRTCGCRPRRGLRLTQPRLTHRHGHAHPRRTLPPLPGR